MNHMTQDAEALRHFAHPSASGLRPVPQEFGRYINYKLTEKNYQCESCK